VILFVAEIRPETQAYIQKLEQEKLEKAKGQQADNRSFFAKYVSYIHWMCAVSHSNDITFPETTTYYISAHT